MTDPDALWITAIHTAPYVPPTWKPPTPGEPRHASLTARQAQVLTGICHGYSNREIGRRLYITEDTVKCHVRALLRALAARDRAHAAALSVSRAVHITIRDLPERRAA